MIIQGGSGPKRPVYFLLCFLFLLCGLELGLFVYSQQRKVRLGNDENLYDIAAAGLGLTDLCVATEARYTRHPAVSDPVAPFMDHPGAIEHFPTGSFWAPPSALYR